MAGSFCIADLLIIKKIYIAVLLTVLVLLCIYMYLIIVKKFKFKYLFIILFFLLGAICSKNYDLFYKNINEFLGKNPSGIEVMLEGDITQVNEDKNNVKLLLKKSVIFYDDKKINAGGIIAYIAKDTNFFKAGDKVFITGKLKAFDRPMNFGEFDASTYYYSQGISGKISVEQIEIKKKNENKILEKIFIFKANISKIYDKILDEKDTGIVTSIILGDKTKLDENLSTLYRRNGISHILAISGLHISLIGMAIYRLLRGLKRDFIESAVLCSLFVILYGILTQNAVSSIRAIIMLMLFLYANILGRKYDMKIAASLAALVILIRYPYMLINSGFLLSFCAIIGVCVVNPIFEPFLIITEKNSSFRVHFLAYFVKIIFFNISVSLATLPVLLGSFYEFSVFSIFLNLIVVPLMTLVLISAFLGGIAGLINLKLGIFFVGCAHYILIFYEYICDYFKKFSFGYIMPGKPDLMRVIIYYLLLFLLAFIVKNCHKFDIILKNIKKILLVGVFVLISIIFYNKTDGIEIRTLYVGQGDGIIIKLPDKTNILIDGGSTDKTDLGKYTLKPCLMANGISTVEYAFISHTDTDHISGVEYLLKNEEETGIRIKNLLLSNAIKNTDKARELVRCAESNNTKVIYIDDKTEIKALKDKLSIRCLYPFKESSLDDVNENSQVLLLKYYDFKMLFTGDIEGEGEKLLLNQQTLGKIDVLKVSHHGSKNATTEEFLKKVMPDTAIISCGINNRYNHPNKELLNRLQKINAKIFRTDQNGELIIKVKKDSCKIMMFLTSKYVKIK